MVDIVERLRTETPCYVLIGDAAIEIERLREALKELDKAITTWMPEHSPMRNALQTYTRDALKESE